MGVAVGERSLEAREARRLLRSGSARSSSICSSSAGIASGATGSLRLSAAVVRATDQGPPGLSPRAPRPTLDGGPRAPNNAQMTRRRLPVVALALALLLAAPAGAGSSPLAKAPGQGARGPHVSPARTGRDRVRPADRRDGLRRARLAAPSRPPRTRSSPSPTPRWSRSAPAFRIETDVLGRGAQDGAVWRGSLLLVGHGDPTLSRADLATLARQVRAAGIRSDGRRLRRRVVLRRAPHRRRLEVLVLRATSRRRSRRSPSTAAATSAGPRATRRSPRRCSSATRCAAPEWRSAARGPRRRSAATTCRSPRSSRRRSRRSSPGWTGSATTSPQSSLLKQLGAADDEAGHERRRRGDRPRAARRRRRAARRASGWPTAPGLSLARPPDGAGARRRCSAPRGPIRDVRPVPPRRAAGRRASTARSPTACGARPRAATSWRRPARPPRLGALRLRQAPLRLLGAPERQPGLALLGAARAGPLRDRASRAVASSARPRRAPGRRAARPSRASSPGSRRRSRPSSSSRPSPPTFAPFASSALRASSRLKPSSVPGDHVGRAGQRPLDRPLLRPGLEAQPELPQLLDERAVLLVGEPLDDRLGALRARSPRPRRLLLRGASRAGRRRRSGGRGSAP